MTRAERVETASRTCPNKPRAPSPPVRSPPYR